MTVSFEERRRQREDEKFRMEIKRQIRQADFILSKNSKEIEESLLRLWRNVDTHENKMRIILFLIDYQKYDHIEGNLYQIRRGEP